MVKLNSSGGEGRASSRDVQVSGTLSMFARHRATGEHAYYPHCSKLLIKLPHFNIHALTLSVAARP